MDKQKNDEKDFIISQISSEAGIEIATLLQKNARLLVILAKLKEENKQLKEQSSNKQ